MIIKCLQCNADVSVSPFRFHYGRKFCSRKCCCEYRTQPLAERFWKYVKKTDSCWIWTGAKDGNQYGTIRIKKKTHRTHVIAWKMSQNDPIPDGMCVCHKCDNPSCVNPDHLFIGSRKENTQDMVKKLRGGNCLAKLSEKDVLLIISMHRNGSTYLELAKLFKVHPQSIANIILGKTWKNIHDIESLDSASI